MKRVIAVLLIGLAIVGISIFAGGRGGSEGFAVARTRVDADCRAYRSQPLHRHAEVCHAWDQYSPKAVPLFSESRAVLEHARGALAHGDLRGAESDLARVLASVDDMQRMGTDIATLTASSLVGSTLDLLDEHRELDATRILAGVQLDAARHPFEGERIHHAWFLAHWNEQPGASFRSESDLAHAIAVDSATFLSLDHDLIERHEVAACAATAKKRDLEIVVGADLCEKFAKVIATSDRLDAAKHGSLSSALRHTD